MFCFSCEKETCKICTLHQYSIPLIPEWERIIKFEVSGKDLKYWDGKIDSLILGNIIYITETHCH